MAQGDGFFGANVRFSCLELTAKLLKLLIHRAIYSLVVEVPLADASRPEVTNEKLPELFPTKPTCLLPSRRKRYGLS